VNPTLRTAYLAGTAIALLLTLRFGYIATTEGSGNRKAKAGLVAALLFSSWLCITPLLMFSYDQTLPIFDFSGVITSVQVLNSDSKHFSAYLHIHTSKGGDISIHVSDRSPFLRPGEGIHLQYRGDTGELVKASFYNSEGKQEGVLNSTIVFEEIVGFLAGLFCIWASIQKYRRDPECSES
jgi:hypothetical protein